MLEHIKIGKDVLESLTISMYEDHKSLYREYIQNSCDSIDRAVKNKILNNISDGEIHISIDQTKKEVTIYDNGTGIAQQDVYSILGNIALSDKEKGKDRGFRGIGRLAGLGYCEELIFETSFGGEDVATEMSWDAIKFKQIILDRKHREEAGVVIEQIISQTIKKASKEEHYFKITLKNITNNELLDIDAIRQYVCMVAPVPMRGSFIYQSKINEELKKDGLAVDEYAIFINSEKAEKAYFTHIYEGENGNKKSIDEIFDVNFIKVYDYDKNILCWGWYGVSTFAKQMQKINLARGIRLRKGNIQIGACDALNKLHKEDRGNYYFIGEIHALHDDLIPNARRDYFGANQACQVFEDELRKKFYELYRLYHKASDIRSEAKKIESFTKAKEEFAEKQKNGFLNKEEVEKLKDDLENKQVEAKKAEKKLENITKESANSDVSVIMKSINLVKKTEDIACDESIINTKPTFITQKHFSKYDRQTQKLISKIYIIIDNALPRDTAENLKQKIKEELN